MKIAAEMKLMGQNIRGMKTLWPEAAGRRQVLKQSTILFDGRAVDFWKSVDELSQLVLVMKSIKCHCHKMTK